MPHDVPHVAYRDGSGGLNSITMSCLIFSVVLSVGARGDLAMKYMFIMIRALQMVLHIPLMRIMLPANVLTFIEIMIPTVGFDILESFFNWEDQRILKFDFEKHDKLGDELFE